MADAVICYFTIHSFDVQEGAGLDGVAAGEEVGDDSVEVVASCRGEEAEVAEVDAEDGYVAVTDEVDGAEEGAVATDREEEVVMALGEAVGDLLGLDAALMQQVGEHLELLARRVAVAILVCEIPDVERYFHDDLVLYCGCYRLYRFT